MERGALAVILSLAATLTGCISPQVDIVKTIYITAEGNVTVNMNSGTGIEAQVDQQLEDLVDATIPLR